MTRMPRRAALSAILLVAGCATHDYTYARETRFDRPYLGGAASVPDEPPPKPLPDWNVLQWIAAVPLAAVCIAAAVVHPDDSVWNGFPGAVDDLGPSR
jgi:hypothetical protein